jgi:hypothetical protein
VGSEGDHFWAKLRLVAPLSATVGHRTATLESTSWAIFGSFRRTRTRTRTRTSTRTRTRARTRTRTRTRDIIDHRWRHLIFNGITIRPLGDP